MKFTTLAYEARSCRRFEPRRPDSGTLAELVDCGRVSSSAGNMQPLRYITVEPGETLDKITAALVWAAQLKEWKGPGPSEIPTGYILLFTPKTEKDTVPANTHIDAGIAAQTIQLAARSEGLACCMFRSFNEKKIAEAVNLEGEYTLLLVLAVGYPAETCKIEIMEADGSLKYYRDEKGVHHVPKRPLEDVLIKSIKN